MRDFRGTYREKSLVPGPPATPPAPPPEAIAAPVTLAEPDAVAVPAPPSAEPAPPVTPPPDLDELLEALAAHLKSRRMAKGTLDVRARAVRWLGRYCALASIEDVRQMTRRQVDEYVKWLRHAKLAPRTVECWLSGMRVFFRFLVETNRLLLDPADHVRIRNMQHLVGPTLSVAQMEKLLAAPNTSLPMGVRDRAMLEMLYSSGIRRNELRKLTVFDVDLAGGLLRVQGKGGGERVVPLGRHAARWLRTYLEQVRPRLARRSGGREGEHHLFLGKDGTPLSLSAIVARLAKHGKAAGVRVSCHTLRRTMATELLKGGAQVNEVAAILGHTRVSTTQIYTKVMPVDLRQVHERHHPRGCKG